MTKKNMFRIGAVLMVCVMILSSFSFAATGAYDSVQGLIVYSCSAGAYESSASTSCENGAAYCYVQLYVEYGFTTDTSGGAILDHSTSDSDQDYGNASASCSYSRASGASASSTHRGPGFSDSLSDSF